ncbi:MAG: DUF1080 domain-containing protein [Bacteroidota bacterium]
MRIRHSFVLLLVLPILIGLMQAPKMKKIFNGKNLKGWVEPEGNIWWSVSNGILTAKSGPDKKGSILWTKKSYDDVAIQLEFRMGEGTIDSGIFFYSDKKPHPQIQIGISGSLKRDMTCSPYVPGKGYPVEAEGIKDLLKLDDWNTLKAQVVGTEYTAWLNGKKVMTYIGETEKNLGVGPIGLQLHPSRDMHIDFRNILVEKL